MVSGKFFVTVGLLAAVSSFAAFNPAQDATQPEDLPVLRAPVPIAVQVLS